MTAVLHRDGALDVTGAPFPADWAGVDDMTLAITDKIGAIIASKADQAAAKVRAVAAAGGYDLAQLAWDPDTNEVYLTSA